MFPPNARLKTFILSLGVNHTPNASRLYEAENDAYKVAQHLGRLTGGRVNLKLGRLATVLNVVRYLQRLPEGLDLLVLYFSGHGGPMGIALSDGMLRYGHLARYLRRKAPKRVLVVLDTCHAASSVPYMAIGGPLSQLSWQEALTETVPGLRLICSTGAGRQAGEVPGIGGLFTAGFLWGLNNLPGDVQMARRTWVSAMAAFECASAMFPEQQAAMHGSCEDLPLAPSSPAPRVSLSVTRDSTQLLVMPGCFVGTPLTFGATAMAAGGGVQLWEGYVPNDGSSLHQIDLQHPQLTALDVYSQHCLVLEGGVSLRWTVELYDAFGRLVASSAAEGMLLAA